MIIPVLATYSGKVVFRTARISCFSALDSDMQYRPLLILAFVINGILSRFVKCQIDWLLAVRPTDKLQCTQLLKWKIWRKCLFFSMSPSQDFSTVEWKICEGWKSWIFPKKEKRTSSNGKYLTLMMHCDVTGCRTIQSMSPLFEIMALVVAYSL